MDTGNVIEVGWPKLGIKIEAEPLTYNQKLFGAFCQYLPFETIQLHALVTGEDMYSYCPMSVLEYQELIEKRMMINEIPPYTMTWSVLGLVAIIYGPCPEAVPSVPIARVLERYHQDLRRAGRAAWDSIFTTKEILITQFRIRGK